jgi:hypothetical protein
MKRLIKKILREEIDKSDRHYRRLDIISNYVEIPYFKSMEGLTIDDKDDQLYIMRNKLGDGITIRGRDPVFYENERYIYDDRGNMLYQEDFNGFWIKNEYDDKGNMIYYENSDGWWEKSEYDDKGSMLYSEGSDGDIRDYR